MAAPTPAPWPQPPPAPVAAPPAAQANSDVAPLVLLVEDQPSNIAIIRDLCESVGYQLVVATRGREGVLRAREMQPRLILMDIQLPGMSGIEAIQHLRADAALRHIPIIALSALVLPGDRERCLTAGADDYLPKPIQVAILRARMAAQLARTGPTP